ncbi:MAG: MFS transporter [Lachnospiraceae bacterium]|nr:MFS transporter [Lachnospiraceae bacterium]
MGKKVTIPYCLLQTGYWALAAVAMAYTTPILQAKGYSGTEIGLLSAIKYGSVLGFQMVLGSFSDKNAKKIPLKYLIIILTVVSMVFTYVFWRSEYNMALAVVIFVIFGATINCALALVDSLSIQYMNHGYSLNYTVSRGCGSLAWAIFCVVAGGISDRFGCNQILLFQLLMSAVFIFIAAITPKVDFSGEEQISEKKEDEVHTTGYLLRHYPKFLLFLLAVMIIFMGYNMNAMFMVNLIQELGGNDFDYGVAQFVLALAEIPVALWFYHIRKHMKLDTLMIVCALFCTLRAAGTAFATTTTGLILAQGLELFGLSIFYAGGVFYVMDQVPAADCVKGTSLMNLAGMGLGEMLGSILCGYLKDTWGLHFVMNASVAVSAIGILLMFLMTRAAARNN